MMYYTYVLEGTVKKTGKLQLYVGSTKNLDDRFKQHLAGNVRTTSKLKDLNLIYYEACLNKTDAIKRELQLKTGFGRGYVKRRLHNYFSLRN